MNNHNQITLTNEVKKVLGLEVGDNVGFWIDHEEGIVQLFTEKKH